MFNIFKHKHKWEDRGFNKWCIPTYRVCLKCGEAQERINKPFEEDRWGKCDRIKDLDLSYEGNKNHTLINI